MTEYHAQFIFRTDYIDYPTGWFVQKSWKNLDECHEKCSARQTNGLFLCDCKHLEKSWLELRKNYE